MSMKMTYGIYFILPPTVALEGEGLGHYTAELIKATYKMNEHQFVVACPLWNYKNLCDVLSFHGINPKDIDFIITPNLPAFLRMFQFFQRLLLKYRSLRRKKKRSQSAKITDLLMKFLCTRSMLVAIPAALLAMIVVIITVPFVIVSNILLRVVKYLTNVIGKFITQDIKMIKYRYIRLLMTQIVNPINMNIYYSLMESESKQLNKLIDKRKDIRAWYSPTIFYPFANRLSAPCLYCVPDVVMNAFPVRFASLCYTPPERYQWICKAINTSSHLMTYSEDVKMNTLVKSHGVDPRSVTVIRHGAKRLDEYIDLGNQDTAYCLLENALKTSREEFFKKGLFDVHNLKYIFYASQVRPHKNILTLLRAYNYLLKEKYFNYKLILTGNPDSHSDVRDFINNNHLEHEVIWLNKISQEELAACYSLATLSINPSLSEGGFPFTFTESLSVGTPVIMSRINVTDEIIQDPELRDLTLFDPYDWKGLAAKIESSIDNKDLLLAKQLPFYDKLKERGWDNVVSELVEVLDNMSQQDKCEKSASIDGLLHEAK